MPAGYYHHPTIHQETVVFVCEDDLWSIPVTGGIPRRLTSNPGLSTMPALSPDGAWLAFSGRDEGDLEVYLMPAEGGPAQRRTFFGTNTLVVGWSHDSNDILFASNAERPFIRQYQLFRLPRAGGDPVPLPTGPATSITYGPNGGVVIARHQTDIARWKRYRGGLTGDLWVDAEGTGQWKRLLKLHGNLASPLWIGERIYFVSDHEGIGNLFSCHPDGSELRRHTNHESFYARHPSTDGQRIVYQCGADLYVFDPQRDETQLIPIAWHSSQPQRNRRFVDPERYLRNYDLDPDGQVLALTIRGRPFIMDCWVGPALQCGQPDGVRYKLATWLHDRKRFVAISDRDGEDGIDIFTLDGDTVTPAEAERITGIDIGRPIQLLASPRKAELAITNHRHELILVDIDAKTARVLDHSRYSRIHGMDWSPDGKWLAYSISETHQVGRIKLCNVATGETYPATRPVLLDTAPAFDPTGRYLYFISYRDFDPVYDSLQFDLNFPRAARPCLITLRADLPSPFIPTPQKSDAKEDSKPKKSWRTEPTDAAPADPAQLGAVGQGTAATSEENPTDTGKKTDPVIQIDLEGITERVVAFPVPIGRYGQIRGIKNKALFTVYPIEGSLGQTWEPNRVPPARARLEVYDFEEQSHDTFIDGITNFDVSRDGRMLIYRTGNRLRVIKAGEPPKNGGSGANRKSGWINLNRIRLSVTPHAEWQQMYREAWRLQRDHFWNADMSGIDWREIYARYLPLLDRIGTRGEFSDLMWEMQGELGTSHAYEMGGDYRRSPHFHQGFLGADLRYDAATDSYRIERIIRGDVWDECASSPLARVGVGVKVGDRIITLNGRRVGRTNSPGELLVGHAGNDIFMSIADGTSGTERTIVIEALGDETPARYREWVEQNRQRVHDATQGRIGYIHIPDMGAKGYAEFHRGFLAEVSRDGLIVDVRFNGGGNVSQLLLEKLGRRRIGYDVSRWGEPAPYPADSVLGPIVAITNEVAGSDGDIFSHTFKLMGLGPLIGKRTWGGVIGINPSEVLIDGGVTTQPEYSFWFSDVGWGVENYGTDPTIEVDITPEDYTANRDPQLTRAIEEAQRRLAEEQPKLPEFGQRPRLSLP